MNNRIINILLIKDGEIIPLKNDRRMRVSHLMHYFKKTIQNKLIQVLCIHKELL